MLDVPAAPAAPTAAATGRFSWWSAPAVRRPDRLARRRL